MLKKIVITSIVSLMAIQSSFAEKAVEAKEQKNAEVQNEQIDQVEQNKPPRLLTDTTKPLIIDVSDPTVTIRMSANPSTGYQWFVTGYNQEFIKVKSYEYIPAEGHMVGASGVDIWTFEVDKDAFVAPHLFRLTFEYRRPFESEVVKPKVVTIITVPE